MNFNARAIRTVLTTLAVLQGLLIVLPLILTYWLCQLAERAAFLIGRWPVPMINDPKWIGSRDAPYQRLFDVAERVDTLTLGSFFLWVVLMTLLYRWYSVRTRCWLLGLFVIGWGILWFNPWRLLYWWED